MLVKVVKKDQIQVHSPVGKDQVQSLLVLLLMLLILMLLNQLNQLLLRQVVLRLVVVLLDLEHRTLDLYLTIEPAIQTLVKDILLLGERKKRS